MDIGICLPKLNQITPQVLAIANNFDVVSTLDWLAPSHLVFNGITAQPDVLSKLGSARVRGHCLYPAKRVYQPTLWGGSVRGRRGRTLHALNIPASQKKALVLDHVETTVRKFKSIRQWDLVLANVKAAGELRCPWWREILDRAVVARPNNEYHLSEVLGTSKERWDTIFDLTSHGAIAGLGVQVHASPATDLDRTLGLLEYVAAEAHRRRIKLSLSEVGYYRNPGEKVNPSHVEDFLSTVYKLGATYNVKDFIWWGLLNHIKVHFYPNIEYLGLLTEDCKPTFIYHLLCEHVPSLSRAITPHLTS